MREFFLSPTLYNAFLGEMGWEVPTDVIMFELDIPTSMVDGFSLIYGLPVSAGLV